MSGSTAQGNALPTLQQTISRQYKTMTSALIMSILHTLTHAHSAQLISFLFLPPCPFRSPAALPRFGPCSLGPSCDAPGSAGPGATLSPSRAAHPAGPRGSGRHLQLGTQREALPTGHPSAPMQLAPLKCTLSLHPTHQRGACTLELGLRLPVCCFSSDGTGANPAENKSEI